VNSFISIVLEVKTLSLFQACSNTQNFLSQNLDDAMSHFVAPEADGLEDGFNEALQSDCDCRQWAFQFLQPKAPSPIPTLPVEQEFEEHFAHEEQMETETDPETETQTETEVFFLLYLTFRC
jgi:hypothetical protein